jgi:TnpA family transposase
VAARLPANTAVSVDADARLHVTPHQAEDDPPSLVELRKRVQAMLPRVELPELPLEVMTWVPGFTAAFTPVLGGQTKLEDFHVSLAAVLAAQAMNIGYSPVIRRGTEALERDRLSHVEQNYLRPETLAAANAPLITAQADVELAQVWGGGLVASVDGMRFVVPVRTIHARPNPRYFGHGKGVTLLTAVNDQHAQIAGMVVSGTPRDSMHLIDLLYSQDGGRQPEVVITDTGSYSDIVFGLVHLLGRQYRPELADLPDQRLWRIGPPDGYGALEVAARGRINLERIRRHWPDVLRVVASIHTGAVRAYDVLRVQRDGNPTPLGDAIAHYGRIFKSLHVLTYVDDPPYRRHIKGMRNLIEGRQSLARRVFHGQRRELRQRYREGMEDQLGVLGLVLNCLTLWNTVYMDAALAQLRERGYPVAEADVVRLSPFARKHVEVHGRYTIALPNLPGGRRPLRDPDDEDDE